ncbi:hypothetical protein PIIN_01724 [Serendipita indica DSM 11827]|uniref:Uncharacterized protein n=1 Tax=Serendipita indica (strain DSM 11827) TaxID=1109443 RepID=G4U389_SERID|nr:hypothetical protein PIIN_01724 [Serendipita indica DSM 11827]
MASPVSSETSLSASRAFEPSSMPQTASATLDSQAAINQLAAQARISQLAAQLRLRLSYAGYKAQNKLSSLPFSTLEKRLEDDSATPKQTLPVLLLDPLSLDKSLSDTQLMPPPPAPATSLFTTLLDVDIDTRPTKRQKTDAVGSARAIGPSPAGFTQSANPDIKVNGHRHPSTSGKPRSKGSNSSPKKRQKKDSMSDREQLAAKTLASLLVAKSPRSSTKAPSELSFTTEGGNEHKGKTIRRAPSSVSSIDAAMADTTLSTGGDTVPEGSTSGVDTVPGSPVASTAQRERDSAELLLLLATSPSPARSNRRGPPAVNRTLAGSGTIEPRALFAEGSSNSDSVKQEGMSESIKDSSDAGGSGSKLTPSLLLPAPPSPTKKPSTNKTPEDKMSFQPPPHAMPFLPPSSNITKSSTLQAPFTPGGTLALHTASNTTNFGSATGGFGSGFAMAMSSLAPSTPGPSGFNMADYINFTPTPGASYSPAPKAKSKGASEGIGSEKGAAASSTAVSSPMKKTESKTKGSTPESDAGSGPSGEKMSDNE